MNANELLKTSYTGSSNTGDLMLCYTMKQVEAIRTALSSPTFDDAIKVVRDIIAKHHEKKWDNLQEGVNQELGMYKVLDALLAALRERGKGK